MDSGSCLGVERAIAGCDEIISARETNNRISEGSTGVPVSTLQDIRSGRETEIAYLNLEMARIA